MNDRTPLTTRASSPAPAPMAAAIGSALHAHQAGYTLKEVMLGLGIASVAAAATYGLFFRADVAGQVRKETETLAQLATNINSAWGMTGSFEGLVGWKVEHDGMLPEAMKARGGMTSEWGTKVYVSPVTVAGKPNAGFAIEYRGLPEAVCARLATEHQDAFWDIEVDGVSVLAGGNIDTTTAIQRCADGGSVTYTYYDGASGKIANADYTVPSGWIPPEAYQPGDPTPPGAIPPVNFNGACSTLTLPPNQVRSLACEPGEQGAILETRSAACASNNQGAWTWSPWSETGRTCSPMPAGCPSDQTRVASCPSGWSGSRTEQRHCVSNEPVGWSNWYDIENSCVPPANAPGPVAAAPTYGDQCQPLAPETRTQLDCPAGQFGSSSDKRDQVCVYAYQPAVWAAWRETSDDCQDCPAPVTETESRVTPGTAPGPACPSGTTGLRSTATSTPEQRTREISYDCKAGTGLLPSPTESAWSPWAASGPVTNGAVTGTCTPCPAAGPVPSCPAGTTGVVTWTTTPGTDPTATTDGSCPTFSANYSGCTPCPATPANGSAVGACPVGTTGTITWSVTPGTAAGSGTPGSCPVASQVNTCTPCPATPANGSSAGTCPSGQQGSITWSVTPGMAPGNGSSGSCPTAGQVNTCSPCPPESQTYCDSSAIPQYAGEAPNACDNGTTAGQIFATYEYIRERQACTNPASNSTPWTPWSYSGATCTSEVRCPPPVVSCPPPQEAQFIERGTCKNPGEVGETIAVYNRKRDPNCPSTGFDGTWGDWLFASYGPGSGSTCAIPPEPATPLSGTKCPAGGTYQTTEACPSGQTGYAVKTWSFSYAANGTQCDRADTLTAAESFCGTPQPEPGPASHCWAPAPLPQFPGYTYMGPSPYGGGWWFGPGHGNRFVQCP